MKNYKQKNKKNKIQMLNKQKIDLQKKCFTNTLKKKVKLFLYSFSISYFNIGKYYLPPILDTNAEFFREVM